MTKCTECQKYLGGYGCQDQDHHASFPDEEANCDVFVAKSQAVRTFESGATRDTDIGKLNYVKALSPIVLQRYVQYIGQHRVQSDGTLRDWDNWKKGIDKQTYVESLDRHGMAVWLLHEGYPVFDNHGPVTLEDSLCGIIFNAMGYLHEVLKANLGKLE